MALIRKNTFFVPQRYRAITLYPFIFVRNESDKHDKVLINHERIHKTAEGVVSITLLCVVCVGLVEEDFYLQICKSWISKYCF